MTICFVVSTPGVVLAAADTRVGVHSDCGLLNTDGPHDLRVDVVSVGRTVTFPYRQRKIRFLGNGSWAVVAGEFASATLLLDELKSASATQFDAAHDHLSLVRQAIEERAIRETGVEVPQLRKTLVLGGSLAGMSWALGFAPDDPRSNRAPGQRLTNWPMDVPNAVQDQANAAFDTEFLAACQAQNAIGLVHAAARLVGVAAHHSQEASSRAQIGVTVADPRGGYVARYFDDNVGELLRLKPSDLFSSSEVAR